PCGQRPGAVGQPQEGFLGLVPCGKKPVGRRGLTRGGGDSAAQTLATAPGGGNNGRSSRPTEHPSMANAANPSTSPTLLGRLARSPTDQAAWEEFVGRYSPQIHGWCQRWGLQAADAQDVTQDILLELARQMGDFR